MVMVANAIETMISWLATPTYANDSLSMLVAKTPYWVIVLAQQIRETNLWGEVQSAWGHFVQTGQVWALLIGFILGYFIKGFTTFG